MQRVASVPATLVSLILLAGCSRAPAPAPAPPPPAEPVADVSGMDRSVTPGDDFYAYANGEWLKSTEIPADRNGTGITTQMADTTSERIADLLKSIAAAPDAGTPEARKVSDYYNAFMDEAAIEAAALQPLAPVFERIARISDRKTLAEYLGTQLRADVDMLNFTDVRTPNLFGLWVAQDLSDPTRYAAILTQGGLEMPDREYYLDKSPRMSAIRAKYLAHVAAMLKLANFADADAQARRIVDLETRMARTHSSRTDATDAQKGNNHWRRAELDARAPGLDWQTYLTAAKLDQETVFTVWQPGALRGLSALVTSVPLETWKEYLRFHAIEDASSYLPKAFVDEAFAFNGTTLSGTPQLLPRWKRAISATNGALGEAVGKLYVAKWFSAEEKKRAEAMVHNLIAAFGARIDTLDWMTPQTKEKAKAKLATLKVGVGYPDQWRNYDGLEVRKDDAYGNLQRARLFEYQRNLAKLGKPVDRGEWVMTPQTVNAVNLPVMNAMNFPAAILQPPYFDPKRPEVMDYGSTGGLIGHEISHSFDDTGALFDATGRLQNWWTKEDFAHFSASGERLVKQYDAYEPFPGVHVNGKQTLGENIADVAGLQVAYDAYRLSLQGKEPAPVAGFTGDQLFFISYAQSWRAKDRESSLRQQIITDGHSPEEYRGDSVRNLDAWYAAFDVKEGQKLYLAPQERVRVW